MYACTKSRFRSLAARGSLRPSRHLCGGRRTKSQDAAPSGQNQLPPAFMISQGPILLEGLGPTLLVEV
jgi:hypothetical protein